MIFDIVSENRRPTHVTPWGTRSTDHLILLCSDDYARRCAYATLVKEMREKRMLFHERKMEMRVETINDNVHFVTEADIQNAKDHVDYIKQTYQVFEVPAEEITVLVKTRKVKSHEDDRRFEDENVKIFRDMQMDW